MTQITAYEDTVSRFSRIKYTEAIRDGSVPGLDLLDGRICFFLRAESPDSFSEVVGADDLDFPLTVRLLVLLGLELELDEAVGLPSGPRALVPAEPLHKTGGVRQEVCTYSLLTQTNSRRQRLTH